MRFANIYIQKEPSDQFLGNRDRCHIRLWSQVTRITECHSALLHREFDKEWPHYRYHHIVIKERELQTSETRDRQCVCVVSVSIPVAASIYLCLSDKSLSVISVCLCVSSVTVCVCHLLVSTLCHQITKRRKPMVVTHTETYIEKWGPLLKVQFETWLWSDNIYRRFYNHNILLSWELNSAGILLLKYLLAFLFGLLWLE